MDERKDLHLPRLLDDFVQHSVAPPEHEQLTNRRIVFFRYYANLAAEIRSENALHRGRLE
jgi:hypothetical protein